MSENLIHIDYHKPLQVFRYLADLKEELSSQIKWSDAFTSVKKHLLYVLLLVSVVGNIYDLSIVGTYVNNYVRTINLVHVALFIAFFLFFQLKLMKVHVAMAIVVYAITLNIFLSLNFYQPYFVDFFLRETIFIGILVIVSGLIDRAHILVIGFMYLAYLAVAIYFSDNAFLLDNGMVLGFTILSYVLLLFYLFTLFEYGYYLQWKLTHELMDSNTQLQDEQEKLKESEEKFRLIAENAGDFIGVMGKDIKVQYCTPSVYNVLGYLPGDFIGEETFRYIHPEDLSLVKDNVEHLIKTGRGVPVQYRFLHKKGVYIWLETVARFADNGSVITVNRNITQRKNVEGKLRKAVATKDRFFSILAHDLQSPMGQLYGSSQFLKDRFDLASEEDKRLLLDGIFDSAERMKKLLDDLLEWSRTQVDAMVMEPDSINLLTLIQSSLDVLSHEIKEKAIKVIVSEQEQIIKADANAVKTILRNLISNAVKFSLPGGDIVISTHNLGSQVELSITDFGVGIPEERLKNLFQIDKVVSTRGTQNEMGTGLGLAICKELSEKNGGCLGVESQEGKGSRFKLTLPKADI